MPERSATNPGHATLTYTQVKWMFNVCMCVTRNLLKKDNNDTVINLC